MVIPAHLRRAVVERARNRCEYCQLAQTGQEAIFHIDHIVPLDAGGVTDLENLALACVSCSLRKGARRSGADPETGRDEPIFNPRRHAWLENFQWQGVKIEGRSAIGRATIAALRMNRPMILSIREEEALRKRHPPT